jgi:hypothetical protein
MWRNPHDQISNTPYPDTSSTTTHIRTHTLPTTHTTRDPRTDRRALTRYRPIVPSTGPTHTYCMVRGCGGVSAGTCTSVNDTDYTPGSGVHATPMAYHWDHTFLDLGGATGTCCSVCAASPSCEAASWDGHNCVFKSPAQMKTKVGPVFFFMQSRPSCF